MANQAFMSEGCLFCRPALRSPNLFIYTDYRGCLLCRPALLLPLSSVSKPHPLMAKVPDEQRCALQWMPVSQASHVASPFFCVHSSVYSLLLILGNFRGKQVDVR